MLKVLVANRGSLSTQKFVVSRSVYNRVLEPLNYLKESTSFDFQLDVLTIPEMTREVIRKYNIIVYCKHNNRESLDTAQIAAEEGVKTIYDIDDLIYRFTDDSLAAPHMKNVEYLRAHLEIADAVVISTQTLADVMKEDFKLKRELVVRTGINIDKYYKKNYAPTDSKIMFTNGDNIKITSFRKAFTSVFNEFLNRNPATEFEVFGDSEDYLREFSRYNFLGSLPWVEHKHHLMTHQYEFAIVPLGAEEEDPIHQLFSKCKTPIKYYEYGATRIPTIFSNAYIYREVVRNGETGLLVPNDARSWKSALEQMHNDQDFRRQLTDRAFDDVHQHHHIRIAARQWQELMNSL